MASIQASVGRGAANRADDVRTVRVLLNQNLAALGRHQSLAVSGMCGPDLISAIEDYQRRVVGMMHPDGRIDPGGRTLRALNRWGSEQGGGGEESQQPGGQEPEWLRIARAEIGTREIRGPQHNPRILQYLRSVPSLAGVWNASHTALLADQDETPWCAAFVNWCLLRARQPRGPGARAREWMRYGQGLSEPRAGCICVVYHRPTASTSGVTSSGYHVAFWTGGSGDSITLLGGNQSNPGAHTEEVNEKTYASYWTVKAYRWPE